MVNKAIVGVIGIVLIATLGVGALVGLQGGDAPADDTTTNANSNDGNGQDPTPDSNETASNETTANATATPVEEEHTPIPGREFTEKRIADNLTERLNAWRVAEGEDELRADGSTADRLRAMAMDHSVAMADEGELTHVIDNQTSGDRYEENNLYDACMYRPPDKERAIYQPDHPKNNQFEVIVGTVAGDTYETDNGTAFNEDEEAVAGALMDEIRQHNESSDRLLAPGLTKVGVGVEVTRDGAVYSTVNVCGG